MALFALASASPALGQDDPLQPRTTFGSVGVIEMPSARMAPDGQLSVGISVSQHTERYDLNFQGLPWLETSLRYTGLSHFEPSGSEIFSVYWDRSFAAKVRLFNETEYTPALAVGLNDLIGTGVYSSEYLVASKRFGDFDTTLGLGWGRLADTGQLGNPLGALSKSFKTRSGLASAGGTNFSVFFHGPKTGLFGGLVWHSPIDGLLLNVEYSSDKQVLESTLGTFTPHKSQINYGITYQPFDSMTVGLSWLYGKTAAVSLSFQTDPTTPNYTAKITPTLPPVQVRTPAEQQQALENLLNHGPFLQTARTDMVTMAPPVHLARDAFVDHLLEGDGYGDVQIEGRAIRIGMPREQTLQQCRAMAALAQSYGGGFDAIVLESGPAPTRSTIRCAVPAMMQPVAYTIDASGPDPHNDAAAIRTIRADLATQDFRVESLSFTGTEVILYYNNQRYFREDEAVGRIVRVLMADTPPRIEKFRLVAKREQEFDVLRAPAERAFSQNGTAELLGSAITVTTPPLNDPAATVGRQAYPRFNWDLSPQFRQSFFDPQNPIAVQFVAALEGDVELVEGLTLTGTLEANLYNDFPKRPSNSVLPHVRTDSPLYVHEGGNGILDLMGSYQFRLARDVFALAKVGYLESMFAGAGGEVLWRPETSRWAIGADLYDVKQRDFNRLFGLQNYSVITGHITAYYQSPWYDLDFQVRAGQYLAGDKGVTVQVSRRFSTGVEVGVFFTKTNISAARFGEGSFDKGIIVRIPLGWALPIETQATYAIDLRPVQRDGGQTLAGDATLYDNTFRTGDGEIIRQVKSFVAP